MDTSTSTCSQLYRAKDEEERMRPTKRSYSSSVLVDTEAFVNTLDGKAAPSSTGQLFHEPVEQLVMFHSISAAEFEGQGTVSEDMSDMVRSASPTSARSSEMTSLTIEERGEAGTTGFRMFFQQQGKVVSPWHDIPLHAADGCFNFICEIPKETSAKFEVATNEPGTPIKQDIKKGNLRFHPYNINWNYGLLPQTWEDPAHTHPELQCAGDNDPVDVVEIGSLACRSGGVYRVKALGVLAMIDDGELDWKVLAICMDDPKAHLVEDVEDVRTHFPGTLEKIHEWFRDYKIPDGKPPNKFGYDAVCQSKAFTLDVIEETHEAYMRLKTGERANTEKLALA